MLKAWFGTQLWIRVLIALALGAVTGLIWGDGAAVLKPFGDFFINAIRMLIVPLVFSTLISGITHMDNPATLGRQGLKTMGLYFMTTAVAISLGIGAGLVLQPGAGVDIAICPDDPAEAARLLEANECFQAPDQPDMMTPAERIINLIPTNPVAALAEGNILQIITFAIILGVGIIIAGEPARPLKQGFDALAAAMFKVTNFVMELAPFGVFALIAWVAGTQDIELIFSLGKLALALYTACLLHILITHGILIRVFAQLPFARFLRGVLQAQAVAYSTASSSATLPVSLTAARQNLGVSNEVSGFVLPLGSTMNMDGTALYIGLAAVFAAQVFGVDLSLADYGTLVLTATLVSIGAAGVPSASLILMGIAFEPLGLPLATVGFIAGVDRILDMMRTLTNVTGDLAVATIVAKTEKELDEDIFRAKMQ